MEKYPHLKFQKHWAITPKSQYELGQCDAIIQAISNTPILPEYYDSLLSLSLTKGAQATTAIEGNTLTAEEVQTIADGHSLPPSKEYQEKEVRNILEAFNAILQLAVAEGIDHRITPDLLLGFHRMIGKDLGDQFDAIPGQFRSDPRVVGPYRCPDHEDLPALVTRLSEWLPAEFRFGSGQTFADAVIQAIVTHIYIEWIHPFGDGNGRTGRLVEFYILLRWGNPDIASHILANFYNETRPEYYRQIQLAFANKDLTSFIEYAVEGMRDGLLGTLRTIQNNQYEITWIKLIYDRFAAKRYVKKTAFVRQRALALAIPTNRELTLSEIPVIDGEVARLYANMSERTIRRDIDALLDLGILTESDGGYRANTGLLIQQVARRKKDAQAV